MISERESKHITSFIFSLMFACKWSINLYVASLFNDPVGVRTNIKSNLKLLTAYFSSGNSYENILLSSIKAMILVPPFSIANESSGEIDNES